MGAFSDSCHELRERGLAPIPVEDKTPLVTSFTRWKAIPGHETLRAWAARHPEAEVGIVTGKLSGLYAVDVDDRDLLPQMLTRFGSTPLVTRTRNGFHLLYKASDERCGDLRRQGLNVDLRGQGGFIVAPPTDGYDFYRGTWDDLTHLPTASNENVPIRLGRISIGHRNNELFSHCLRQARFCDTEIDLMDVAETFISNRCEDPSSVTSPEIRATAKQAWRYQTEGRNWVGREARVTWSKTEALPFAEYPEAFYLETFLRQVHGARDSRGEPFAISPRAMERNEVIPRWDARKVRNARQRLVEMGRIEYVHHGGRGKGDPDLFRFCRKGADSAPNVIEHRPPGYSDGESH